MASTCPLPGTQVPIAFYQVAAVCYRRQGSQLEFLLVNTSRGRWTFPKGHIEPGMSDSAAAAREAHEEAGVFGSIDDAHFYSYRHTSKGREYPIRAFLMKVEHRRTPGELYRRPRWFSQDEAKHNLSLLRESRYAAELHRVIDAAVLLLNLDPR